MDKITIKSSRSGANGTNGHFCDGATKHGMVYFERLKKLATERYQEAPLNLTRRDAARSAGALVAAIKRTWDTGIKT
jgi:hypothetical protein